MGYSPRQKRVTRAAWVKRGEQEELLKVNDRQTTFIRNVELKKKPERLLSSSGLGDCLNLTGSFDPGGVGVSGDGDAVRNRACKAH
jgi:hypothetical protein